MHTIRRNSSSPWPLWWRRGSAGSLQLFRRRAVQERRARAAALHTIFIRAGKGVRQIVAGVCQSVQCHQLATGSSRKKT